MQVTFVEKPKLTVFKIKNVDIGFIFNLKKKTFNGTVVNRILSSIHELFLEFMFTTPQGVSK